MSRKALNLDTVFKILLRLKHGSSWIESFKGVLPGSTSERFQIDRLKSGSKHPYLIKKYQ